MADWISFTTDYGLADGFVAACTGVIARIAPHARVIDVTHLVPPQDIRRGATVLAQTVPFLPAAVHLAVVDPGVGTARRAVVLDTPGGPLVGPDNGLLVPAAEALGGVRAAHRLTDPRYRLPTVSATFHGRDLFAPAAAHLAAGTRPDQFGPAVDPHTLVRLPDPETTGTPDELSTEVLSVDRFGNLQLAATGSHLDALPGRVRLGAHEAVVGRTFGDAPAGDLVVYVDSSGQAAVAVNGGSAADRLGAAPGDKLTLTAIR
ncbi:MAG TPA: SAM-dependent chlorinase/fluorinase [Actinophytocola sp.]|uniref:SAM hydrolase/SAM-dependent halogenase family protein n=1 Tax=Actinophytocola sp. TaxID=1872138 RepID=UPI002DBDB207|nr:SAM-dependent chlorinase/fluorinase [Actinophytocola sp.]HEU5474057.1 SAM-dependent chlorinase/fluorinase [Actinophytocola sp.]